MAGLPVTIRLLDPPLHEFLPDAEEVAQEVERARIERTGRPARSSSTRSTGSTAWPRPTRCSAPAACGSAILHPEIYEMQVRAIVRAALAVRERTGEAPELEIMIPLVAYERELELMRELVERRGRGGAASGLDLHDRHDDRAAAGLLRRRPDRRARRLLLVRHQRPHPDRARLLARRRRGRASCRATSSARSSTAARSRRSTSPGSAGSCGSPPGSGARPSPS